MTINCICRTILKSCSCRRDVWICKQSSKNRHDSCVVCHTKITNSFVQFFIFTCSQIFYCAAKLYVSYICLQSLLSHPHFSRSVHVGCSVPRKIIIDFGMILVQVVVIQWLQVPRCASFHIWWFWDDQLCWYSMLFTSVHSQLHLNNIWQELFSRMFDFLENHKRIGMFLV